MRYLLLLITFSVFYGNAQISIMQEELLKYNSLGLDETYYQTNNLPAPMANSRSNCTLNKMIFGWHPYWQNGLEANYQWNLLSDLCFFGYEVDASTGNAVSTHGWSTNNAVTTALAQGKKVHLCVTLFSNHATFFGSSSAQTTLINNLINLIQTRGAHGINIDFEGVPSSQSANMTNFMINLSNALHAANPNYQLSICLYAVDWSNVFDEPVLSQYVDFFTIMGYDYYWSGSSQAGPNDPLYGFTDGYDRSLSRTITYYINAGIPANKLVLGLPYYGREWETVSNAIPSNTTGNNVFSRTFRVVKNNTSGFYTSTNAQYNQRSQTTAYIFQNSGTWRQCWITEGYGMRRRFDLVNQRGLKGIGIWALGYDDGYTDFWDAIEAKFTDCSTVPCTDTIYDGGGPLVNYYDNENYTFTISPTGAVQTTLNFQSFATEANYDTLWLYDGPSTSSPLIGAYHGNNSPGFITSSGPSITLRFKSDGSTRAAGWMAVWNCITDNTPPTTFIQSPASWITQDTLIQFTDADNLQLDGTYWNVSDFDGTYWRCNPSYGFYNDDFSSLHADWQISTGNWIIENDKLKQTNEAENNTNIYAWLDQSLSDEYVYEWKGTTTGSGTNRRSGFHFASDNGSLPNRGNSYFVWFRIDNQNLQFYKVTNDVFSLVHTVPFTTTPGVEYLYRVIYNRITGKISVFVNGQFVGSWTDTNNPYQNGQYISFRSGNAIYTVDDLKVYRSRTSSNQITIGNNSAMIRYQNPDPMTPAAKISSLVKDQVHLFTSAEQLLNIDWTAPEFSGFIHDGVNNDVDTFINTQTFAANWQGWSDPHSGIVNYNYGTGTAPGQDDVIPFTNNGLNEFCSYNSTAIQSNGTQYFHTIQAVNQAGLINQASSNGFYLILTTTSTINVNKIARIYPNPANKFVHIESEEPVTTVRIIDHTGRTQYVLNSQQAIQTVNLQSLAAGTYFMELNNKTMIRIIIIP